MKKISALFAAALILLCGCSFKSSLLENLEVNFEDIKNVVLTNSEGQSVTVSNQKDFEFLKNYTKTGKLPEDRETEVFDSSNYVLCTINTSDGSPAAIYLFNTGEIVCLLGDDADSKYYLFETSGQKADKAYVDSLFSSYKLV